jgi:hypothetical protein
LELLALLLESLKQRVAHAGHRAEVAFLGVLACVAGDLPGGGLDALGVEISFSQQRGRVNLAPCSRQRLHGLVSQLSLHLRRHVIPPLAALLSDLADNGLNLCHFDWLVSGAACKIGAHLVRDLAEDGRCDTACSHAQPNLRSLGGGEVLPVTHVYGGCCTACGATQHAGADAA